MLLLGQPRRALFTWISEQSWRGEWRPQVRQTSCRRTYGCLDQTEGSQKDEPLARRRRFISFSTLIISQAACIVLEKTQKPLEWFCCFFRIQTYIFLFGLHPSLWQKHVRVVDKLNRRYIARIPFAYYSIPVLCITAPLGYDPWSYGRGLQRCHQGQGGHRPQGPAPELWEKAICFIPISSSFVGQRQFRAMTW